VITLTENAVQHAKQALEKRGKGIGVRIGTKRNGCSGLAYTLEYIDQEPEGFLFEFDNDGIKVYVDPKDYVYLDGLTMDYVKKGLNEGFEFSNPNEKGRCGCGESFSV
jgi:iron-sulfur cluster assembly protein